MGFIQKGAVVRLNSGGIDMTVEKVGATPDSMFSSTVVGVDVRTVWMNKNNDVCRGKFDIDEITIVKE